MKTLPRIFARLSALVALSLGTLLFAQESPPPEPPAEPSQPGIASPAALEKTDAPKPARRSNAGRRGNGAEVVTFGSDIVVHPGQFVPEAVAIMGDITIDGEVREAVAILGSITANTSVSQTVSIVGSTTINAGANEAVAVVGNVYVNSRVKGDVVAVCGAVELGPDARVGGQVVALGGGVKRTPSATIGGQIIEFKLFKGAGGFNAWITRALAKGRLLAFGPGLAWAWMVAGVFLACYLLTTLLFPKAVTASAESLEKHPGPVLLTALLTAIILPIIGLLLAVTIVGPLVWFFFSIALALVGKAAFMAWMGRRATNPLGIMHPALAVLLGGVMLALVYCVPILGILVWKLSGFIGAGMAVYAAILVLRRRRAERDAALAAEKAARDAANPPVPGVPPPIVDGSAPVAPQAAVALASRAGFWIRAGALLIDFLLVGAIAKFCDRLIIVKFLHFPSLLLLLFAAYCMVMWALRGTTIGGIVCGLKIVRRDGRPVDWVTAAVRALGGFVSMLPAGLGFIWVVIDDERQAWHDKIAGTVVVHAPKGQSLV